MPILNPNWEAAVAAAPDGEARSGTGRPKHRPGRRSGQRRAGRDCGDVDAERMLVMPLEALRACREQSAGRVRGGKGIVARIQSRGPGSVAGDGTRARPDRGKNDRLQARGLSSNQSARAEIRGETGPRRKSVDAPVDEAAEKDDTCSLAVDLHPNRQGLITLRKILRWFPKNRPWAVVSVRVTKR